MLREILVTILGSVIVVHSYVLTKDQPNYEESVDDFDVCNSKECESMANLITNAINKTADPCEDFYSYACGSWPKNFPVAEGKLIWNLAGMVQEKIADFMKKILQEKPSPLDSVPLSDEKKWIKACMDEDRIEQRGLEPLVKIIENIGGWPLAMETGKWNKTEYPWQKVAEYYLDLIGQINLFSLGIMPNSRNSSSQILSIGLLRENAINREILGGALNDAEKEKIKELFESDFFNVMPTAYAAYTGNEIDSLRLLNDTMRYVQFDASMKLIKSYSTEKMDVDLDKHKMTIDQLQNYTDVHFKNTAKINWLQLVRTMMKDTGIQIQGSEPIAIINKPYLDRILSFLEKWDDETIVNYLHWNFVLFTINYLNKDLRDALSKQSSIMTGIKSQNKERIDLCIATLFSNDGVTHEYLKKYFSKNIKGFVTKVAAEIRQEINNDISQSSWMDRKTKLLAEEKLNRMKVSIGYPDYFEDEKKFNNVNNGLEVGPDFFENVMGLSKYARNEQLKDFRKPFDKNMWFMKPLTSNAYYLGPTNSLTIPAGQILTPLFSMEGPFATNYGSVGFVAGHEMSHGFDVTGRQYDKDGNALPWWPDEVVTEYDKRANCFIKQYDGYKVNGKLTQGENIADTSGLNAAFSAYRKMMKNVTKEMRLAGLEHISGNQMFFISFANTFCESTTPFYDTLTKKDVHTKASVRINGAVSNVEGFAEAFQCPQNSLLNPEKKCILWD